MPCAICQLGAQQIANNYALSKFRKFEFPNLTIRLYPKSPRFISMSYYSIRYRTWIDVTW